MMKFLRSKKIDFAKLTFNFVVISVILVLSFGYGLYSATKQNATYKFVLFAKQSISLFFSESKNVFKPVHFMHPSRYPGSGVTINSKKNTNDELILLSGFFKDNNELRLITRAGKIVARWPVKFSDYFPNPTHSPTPPATDWNIDLHGFTAHQDGSIVFNFEYGGLVKLDRCGKLIWALPTLAHHSVESAEAGGYWVPGRIMNNLGDSEKSFQPFSLPYKNDLILKVSEKGEITQSISVTQLLYDNNFEAVLTANGETISNKKGWDHELVHLNKITELKSDIADTFPIFNAGDLLLSLRTYNTLLVFDPKTLKVKWLKTGPWIRQHDPEFKKGGIISVFNNNTYLTSYKNGKVNPSIKTVSNIIEINPSSGKYKIVYGDKDKQPFISVIRGKHDLLPNNGLLITEHESGRAFEVDAKGNVIWQYINRYDENTVLALTEARMYPKQYFKVSDWSCNNSGN